MNKPCVDCPWVSREQRDIAAITPTVRESAKNGQWFCCHVRMGTCWGAVAFGAAQEMPKQEEKKIDAKT